MTLRPRPATARANTTARRAAEILVEKDLGFVIPTAKQKKNLVLAFAKQDMIVYGRAFDIVRLSGQVDLSQLDEVERDLAKVTLYEIKSTAKKVGAELPRIFFRRHGGGTARLAEPQEQVQVRFRRRKHTRSS